MILFAIILYYLYLLSFLYIIYIIVLKPGPAGRPETRPTRGWNRAGLKKNRGRKNPVWPGCNPLTFIFFITKTTLFWLKKKNWLVRPGDLIKTQITMVYIHVDPSKVLFLFTRCTLCKAPFICWKVVFFWKVNSGKVFSDVW